jgi:hypothetical protein
MGLVMFFEFAGFLPMCELVIISHELKLLMMGTVFFIGEISTLKIRFLPRPWIFHGKNGTNSPYFEKKDFFQIFMISLSRWSRI